MARNGGPAFPRQASFYVPSAGHPGMLLRDYFAAKAMLAELNTAGISQDSADALQESARDSGQTIEQRIAENAYRMADAMLVERER